MECQSHTVQKVGLENYKNFLNDLELFEKINFDLEEVGKLKMWGGGELEISCKEHLRLNYFLKIKKITKFLNFFVKKTLKIFIDYTILVKA